MTTNNTAFLSDRTGNRRYAPVEVGVFSADEIVPDIPQLWAEGREIFKEFGGLRLHRDVEKLTEVINESYVLPDSWEAAVGDWLQSQANLPEGARAPLQSRTILQMALQFDDKQVRRDDLARLAEVMQSLGYRYGPVRHAGGVGKAWQKRGQNL
jgi:predicted P-loop ATPase